MVLTKPTTPTQPTSKLRNRVELEVADLREATAVIVRNHYLHRGRTMAQMPYWILLDRDRAGVLLYAYPRMSAGFQGYGPMNLIELARMWLDPAVQGLRVVDSQGREHALTVATCAVGKSLRRIRQDWHGKYPHLPDIQAVVSWADQEHHEGTIYKASNFREVGVSGGSLHGSTYRRNGGHDQLNPDYLHLKTAFLFEFGRGLSTSEKEAAESTWRGWRLLRNGISIDQLTKMQSRWTFKADSMRGNVPPRHLGVIQSEAAVADSAESLKIS